MKRDIGSQFSFKGTILEVCPEGAHTCAGCCLDHSDSDCDLVGECTGIIFKQVVPAPLVDTPKNLYLKSHKVSGIKVGDKVKVLRALNSSEKNWHSGLYSPKYVGKVGLVIADYNDKGFLLKFDTEYPVTAPWFVLEVCNKDPECEELSQEEYLTQQNNSGIKVGDTVRITRKAKSREQGWAYDWDFGMNLQVGRIGTVIRNEEAGGFVVSFPEDAYYPGHQWAFPWFVLEVASSKKDPATDILDGLDLGSLDKEAFSKVLSSFIDSKRLYWGYPTCNEYSPVVVTLLHFCKQVHSRAIKEEHLDAYLELVRRTIIYLSRCKRWGSDQFPQEKE